MKKKLSFGLALAMVLSLAACGNNGGTAATTTTAAATTTTTAAATTTKAPETTTTEATTEAAPAPVEAEPLPDSYLLLSFEDTDGITSVEQVEDKGELTGANFGIAQSEHPILIAEGQGASGNALYLDGKYGVKLNTVPEYEGDAYTVSFWYNADRVSTYGPVLQVGRNIGMDPADATVTWLNFTKSTWGTNDADIFPVAWNRNSEFDVWPWIYAMDDQVHGKREWCMVTISSNGTRYVADDGLERVETKFYINGELKWEANSENMYYQGLSPEILKGDGIEGYIGINYWDTIFKGFIDELYMFDTALTDGQVKTLYEMGNPPATPVAPEYDGGAEEPEPEPVVLAPITPDASAIATLGNTDRELGWWTDHTDGYELADGKSVKFNINNYSNGINNWNNFVLAFSNTPVKADKIPSANPEDPNFANYDGYAEYAVIRADAYGWGDASYNANFEMSWTDWAGWLSRMTCANAEIVCTRNGGEVTIDITFHFADSGVETEKAVFTSAMTAESPVYVHIGGEGAYIELLSVE